MRILKEYQRRLNSAVLIILFFLFMGGMFGMRYFAGKVAAYNDFQTILDLRLGYSFAECKSYICGLGETGRWFYANCFFYIDICYMIIYNTFYFSALSFLLEKTALKKFRFVLLFPLFSFVFDLGENLFIRKMIKNFFAIPKWLCYTSNIFTILKFIFAYSSLGICGLLVVVLIKHHVT